MFNVVNKYSSAALGAVMLAMLSASCGNAERDAAEEMSARSAEMIEARDYVGAISLLDTIDNRYRSLTDVRRTAMRLRAQAEITGRLSKA